MRKIQIDDGSLPILRRQRRRIGTDGWNSFWHFAFGALGVFYWSNAPLAVSRRRGKFSRDEPKVRRMKMGYPDFLWLSL